MSAPERPVRRLDRMGPIGWLLVVPIVICLLVPVYNRNAPELFGIPFFYWGQLAIIPIGVVCTLLVYRTGERRGRGDEQ